MNNNGILPPEQSGFRQNHSATTTTTTRFVHFLQQTAALVLYIDFTKAFDQIWHDGLLFKLHQMDCPVFNREKGVAQGS